MDVEERSRWRGRRRIASAGLLRYQLGHVLYARQRLGRAELVLSSLGNEERLAPAIERQDCRRQRLA